MNNREEAPIQKLLDYFKNKTTLSQADEDNIAKSYHLKHLKKKEYLFRQGEICKYQGFVTKGTFRIFYLDDKGLEHVLYFAFENWWVGDIAAFMEQEPAALNAQALQDSEILLVDFNTQEKLLTTVPALEKIFRVITQRSLIVLQKRFLMTVSSNIEARFNELLQRCPTIEQLVPQHQIASYLGILPESLSRMKKQIATKDRKH